MNTLKELDIGRNNNFDLLRFVAATMVIFSHSYLVTGNFNKEPLAKFIGFLDLGAFGVLIFFAISGFLVTKSMLSRANPLQFIAARVIRIFPGLCVAAFFCGFVIGPLCTTLSLRQYFTDAMLFDFIWRHVTLINFPNSLPGVFEQIPYPGSVNSPIWTLRAEILLYSIVLSAGIMSLILKKRGSLPGKIVMVLVIVALYIWALNYQIGYLRYVKLWAYLFMWGAFYYLLQSKIPVSIPLCLVLLFIFASLAHFNVRYLSYYFGAFLIYALIVLAYHPLLQFSAFHKLGDCSYGLYIYAFPIQQLIVLKFPPLHPFSHFLVSFMLAFPIAWLSWHFIEKPILGLKPKVRMPLTN